MGTIVELRRQRSAAERLARPPEMPVVTQQGLRLPDNFDFADLKAFLDAVSPPGGGDERKHADG